MSKQDELYQAVKATTGKHIGPDDATKIRNAFSSLFMALFDGGATACDAFEQADAVIEAASEEK
jgi:hypothetical protein